ncbi:unnamed protein product [Nippostrongylus brasiliensis]|uniref:Vinculin n=1 Tax=Nippostrongylus brasiliensis TaxID=27835 RepID=A0A0N4YAE6_NIPBR|nr:unnamed protein product [Nippostrongylus brasiliensis]
MLQEAARMMEPVLEHKLYVIMALKYEKQGLSALLNRVNPWDQKYDEVAKNMVSAAACLVLAAELKRPVPNGTDQEEALDLFDGQKQPETVQKAVTLAEKVLNDIIRELPPGSFTEPLLRNTPYHSH